MDNLQLKPISFEDIGWLNKTEYRNLSFDKRKTLVEDAERGICGGKYFRFFLVLRGGEKVGIINMCGHENQTISVAPEIQKEYRGIGYGKKSLELAYAIAKKDGFKFITAGIREDNIASQNLHIKLGFKFEKTVVSKNGNLLKIYSKIL
jgi:RimJ/RimL family protein N-acetyltransferase